MPTDDNDHHCALCRRGVPKRLITLHHLKPKSRGGKAEHRVPLCRMCHRQIHAMFDNRTLDRDLADLDKLREHPLLQPFMKWIVKQAPDRNFATHAANEQPRPGRIRRQSR